MKARILTALTAIAFIAALVFVFPTHSTTSAASANSAVPQERREQAEDLHRAENKLREARDILKAAPGEYGGHRDKAIGRIDEALAEVHEAWEHRSR